MVLWRAKEGIRQSPGAPEASNSFQIFHDLHMAILNLGYQSKQLLQLIYSFPKLYRVMDRRTQLNLVRRVEYFHTYIGKIKD